MPSIHLPYINIALDAFALVITLIIFIACVSEFSNKKIGSKHFLTLQLAVAAALVADIMSWIGEGQISLSYLTVVSNTLASCACQIAIISFMGYLISSLYSNSRAAACILNIFRILCVCSILFCIGNAFFGYAFSVNFAGHWQRCDSLVIGMAYLAFRLCMVCYLGFQVWINRHFQA